MANPIKQLIKMNNAENYPVSPVKAGGGADLPTVTDADNGKVLSVNNGVWGVSPKSLLPHTQIIAPEQMLTITSETAPQTGVPITLAEGYELPKFIPEDWSVTVNGLSLSWESSFLENGGYMTFGTIGETFCVVGVWQVVTSPVDSHLALVVSPSPSETPTVVPGDYIVKITKDAPARIPAVAAFPVSVGSGSIALVIEAPAEEVDAAMANGCVLLYAASPSDSGGFAFGCLVRRVLYSASIGEKKVAWFASTVTLRDGKYVVRGEG